MSKYTDLRESEDLSLHCLLGCLLDSESKIQNIFDLNMNMFDVIVQYPFKVQKVAKCT